MTAITGQPPAFQATTNEQLVGMRRYLPLPPVLFKPIAQYAIPICGPEAYEKLFRERPGENPEISSEFAEKYWKKRKFDVRCALYLRPKTVTNIQTGATRNLTLNLWGEMVQRASNGGLPKPYRYFDEEVRAQYGDSPAPEAAWIEWEEGDVQGRGLPVAEQRKLIQDLNEKNETSFEAFASIHDVVAGVFLGWFTAEKRRRLGNETGVEG